MSAIPPVSSGDRDLQLRVILDDIGPNCQRCKLAQAKAASKLSSAPAILMPS